MIITIERVKIKSEINMKLYVVRESNCNTGSAGYIDLSYHKTKDDAKNVVMAKFNHFMNIQSKDLEITFGGTFVRIGSRLIYICEVALE